MNNLLVSKAPLFTFFGPPMWALAYTIVFCSTPGPSLIAAIVLLISFAIEAGTTAAIEYIVNDTDVLSSVRITWFMALVMRMMVLRIRTSYRQVYVDARLPWIMWKPCKQVSDHDFGRRWIAFVYEECDRYIGPKQEYSTEIIPRNKNNV